jgi:hypothetical protein
MRTKLTSRSLAAACGLLLAGCCTAHPKQWEYKVEYAPEGIASPLEAQQKLLNDLGTDGWVLVAKEGGNFLPQAPETTEGEAVCHE